MYFYIFIKKMTFIWRPADKEITTELENNGHTLEYAPKEAGTFWGEVISNIYEDVFVLIIYLIMIGSRSSIHILEHLVPSPCAK